MPPGAETVWHWEFDPWVLVLIFIPGVLYIGSLRGFLRPTDDFSIMSGGMPLHPAQRGVTRGLC